MAGTLLLLLAAHASATDPRKACLRGSTSACVRTGDAMSELDRPARRWYRLACTPSLRNCAPLMTGFDEGWDRVAQARVQCDDGNGDGCNALGRFFTDRAPRAHIDEAEGVAAYMRGCELGEGWACARAAEWYDTGFGAEPPNALRATRLLRDGCNRDWTRACIDEARRVADGMGVPPDPGAGAVLLERACSEGRATACAELGTWRADGRGAPPDPTGAAEAWGKACSAGHDCADLVAIVRKHPDLRAGALDAVQRTCASHQLEAYPEACAVLVALDASAPAWAAAQDLEVPELACSMGHALSCWDAADRDSAQAAQLRAEAARLERQPPRQLERGEAPAWTPEPDAACMERHLALLAGEDTQGRQAPSLGHARALDWIEAELSSQGLEVQRQPVRLPVRAVSSWIQVGDERFAATAAPGTPAGAFDGFVHVLLARPEPPLVLPSHAVAAVWPSGLPVDAPALVADRPVLAVSPEALAAVRAADATSGWSTPPDTAALGANVLGVRPGRGPHADEVVVLGAHLDAYGLRDDGVRHPGADDNASGTAGVLCAAAALSEHLGERDARTLVFAAFDGEELGLLGSRTFTWGPVPGPAKAMVNLDMIGRSSEELMVKGGGPELVASAAAAAPEGWTAVAGVGRPRGTSDHLSFLVAGAAAVHLSTGTHADAHTPSDTLDKVDVEAAAAVAASAAALVAELATAPQLPGAEDPCSELGVLQLGIGFSPDVLVDKRQLRVRCVDPDGIGADFGIDVGDLLLSSSPPLHDLEETWPREPVTLDVRRGRTCLRLRLGEEPQPRACKR